MNNKLFLILVALTLVMVIAVGIVYALLWFALVFIVIGVMDYYEVN